ncbi:MAG: MFS transporter [Acidocella sp.]|nr:MFS transporter [Acidocella sp.]
MNNNRVNVAEAIEAQSNRVFFVVLLILVATASFFEGFDAQIQGYTAPTITKLWHIQRSDFSPVFVFFQLGFMLGAIGFGNLGDIMGRRLMIVGGVFLFGVFTVAGGLCGDVTSLAATRFVSALFLGAAAPNAIALMIDYSPMKRRAFNVGIMFTLYTLGGAGGGFLSAWLVPHFGWQAVYWVCGLLAMAFSGILLQRLPESVRYMVIRHKHQAALAAIMQRLAPSLTIGADTVFFLPQSTERTPWVGELFTQHRGLMTFFLWSAYSINLMGLIFVTSWMPTVFADSGLTVASAVIATSLYQLGGATGSVLFGWILDRAMGIFQLAVICLVAVPIIIAIGHATGVLPLVLVLTFLAGICIVGTQNGLNALSGVVYPTYLRSTGSGWTSGIGRIGAIIGPLLGGVLISMHLPLTTIFVILALPSLCVAACLFGINRFQPRSALESAKIVDVRVAKRQIS